jgi:hypothetical protein
MLLAILLSGAITAPAPRAQHEPPKPATARYGNPTSTARVFQDYLYGVIKKINANELVLEKTKFGVDQAFKLEPKTKYIRDDKPTSLDDLKVGDKVWVDVKKDKKTGELIAKKVVTGMAAALAP